MQNVEDAAIIVERFFNKEDNQIVAELITALREARKIVEQQSRVDEVTRLIKFHQSAAEAADANGNEDEKNYHLATTVVLEARISYLEKPRETPPVTS